MTIPRNIAILSTVLKFGLVAAKVLLAASLVALLGFLLLLQMEANHKLNYLIVESFTKCS